MVKNFMPTRSALSSHQKSIRTTSVNANPPGPAARDTSLFLVNQLCFAVYSTSLAMTKLYRPLLAKIGLTYPQYVVLLALWELDGMTVSALGESVALDSGTLTPLLKRLEAQGLIDRKRSAADERQVHIHLTRNGARLEKQAHAVHTEIACATNCSGNERRELTHALQKLRASLLANHAS